MECVEKQEERREWFDFRDLRDYMSRYWHGVGSYSTSYFIFWTFFLPGIALLSPFVVCHGILVG